MVIPTGWGKILYAIHYCMEEVTMELDNPPLAVINDMDTTIEDKAVSQPVDDTIIDSLDMEEHQSNKRGDV